MPVPQDLRLNIIRYFIAKIWQTYYAFGFPSQAHHRYFVQGEPLQQPGHGGPQLMYLRLALLILLFHVAHPPRREMRKAIVHELTSLC